MRVWFLVGGFVFVFFFKQKTAYEMRISDWSSDVCSSDLEVAPPSAPLPIASPYGAYLAGLVAHNDGDLDAAADYMLQALTYDPDNPELLYTAMQLSAATGRRDETVKLSQRILESEPQHSLAVLVMTVERSEGHTSELQSLMRI